MKTQSIKKVILAALLGAFSCVQTGPVWDFTKNAAWYTSAGTASLGLTIASQAAAIELGIPVANAAHEKQYLKAVVAYLKPLSVGATALALANYIDPKDAGTMMSISKHTLETMGKTIITFPLVSASAAPAMDLGAPILKATQNNQYVKALTKYAKPFAIGAATLTLANCIDPKDAGIVMRNCKQALETMGTAIITFPAVIISQELIQRPLFEPYDQQSNLELLGKYLASLGIGFASLKLSNLLSTEHIAKYLRLLMASTAKNAITYPTIFLAKKSFAIDEAINTIEDPDDRQAALMTVNTLANMLLGGLIG